MTGAWRAAGALVAAVATAGLAALSQGSLSVAPSDDARLRLSWRAVGERAEACRPPTEAELRALPPHMRMPEICEGRLLPFRLVVRVDGQTRLDREVRPAGARGDRPLYVLEELPLPAGPHRLEIAFSAVGGDGTASAPPSLLDTRLEPAPRSVVLVTREESSGRLVVAGSG